MPVQETKKRLSQKQLIASKLIEADVTEGQPVYVIRTPRANVKHDTKEPEKCLCYSCHKDSPRLMYGLEFTNGVTVVTDAVAQTQTIRVVLHEDPVEMGERPMTALELAEKVVAEYPDYTLETLQ